MPRYFFDLRCRSQVFPDTEGEVAADLGAAKASARTAAVELSREPSGLACPWSECIFEVRDEGGRLVLWFPFFDAMGPAGEATQM